MTAPAPAAEPTAPDSLDDLVAAALAGRLGPDPAGERVTVGFVTRQGARHPGRARGYRNHVLSLRVGAAVGSCAVEPDELPDDVAYDCVGARAASRAVTATIGHHLRSTLRSIGTAPRPSVHS
ncbi:hypothetical protein AB0C00_18730, partial [Micromonospora carbonacea]